MVRDGTVDPDAAIPEALARTAGRELVDAIRDRGLVVARAHALAGWTGGVLLSWRDTAGGVLADDITRWDQLAAPHRLTDTEREQARRDAVGDAPRVAGWLGERGWTCALDGFAAEVARRRHERDPRGWTDDGTALVLVQALRPAYHVPSAILSIPAPPRVWRDRGDVSLEIEAPGMDVWEHRALGAVLRIYSSHYEPGRTWSDGWREVSWATWCDAVNVSPRRSKEVRAAVDALVRLKGRDIRIHATKPDGSGSVALVSVLQAVQLDHGPGDKGAARRIAHGWIGKSPLTVRVMLSDPLRKLGGVWFPASTDGAMRDAAAEIRGKQTSLDFALRLELYRTRQARDGCAYVDRTEFMRGQLGDATFRAYVRQRHAARKIWTPYLSAVEVLRAAGVVLDWTPKHPTTNGPRDRFQVVATKRPKGG
jgi:hypothetical protein